jgi:hypothetical protein
MCRGTASAFRGGAAPAAAAIVNRYRGKSHDGPQRTAPYPMSRLSAPHELVSMAEEIAAADAMLSAVVGAELEAIARQIRGLQEQAAHALERAQRDALLHRAQCRFRKQPGGVYHLYRNAAGEPYFSLLSPADWRGSPPHRFEGSYRLGVDMRWTAVSEAKEEEVTLPSLPRSQEER